MNRHWVLAAFALVLVGTTVAGHPLQDSPQLVAQAFFDAHTQGDAQRIESTYTPGATVSFTQRGTDGKTQVTTLTVKQYLGWFQGQFTSRTSMSFVVGQVGVQETGGLAAVWVPLEVREVMKDGKQVTFRIVASLQMFRDGGSWKVSGHAWQAVGN